MTKASTIQTTPRGEPQVPTMGLEVIRKLGLYMTSSDKRVAVKTEPKCHTCASPHRAAIESMLFDAVPKTEIVKRLPAGHGVSAQSVKRHGRRGHLPIDHALVARRREIRAEKLWQELGLAGTSFAADEADVRDAVGASIVARIHTGALRLDHRDLLALTRVAVDYDLALRKAERDDERERCHADLLLGCLVRVLELVGEVVGDKLRNEVVRAACDDSITHFTMSRDAFVAFREAVSDEHADSLPPPKLGSWLKQPTRQSSAKEESSAQRRETAA